MSDLDASEFQDLFSDIKQLLSLRKRPLSLSPSNNPTVPKTEKGYQAPLKGSWQSSGGFSMTATDPRHPKGHMGVDMRASGGTPVYPMAPGIVTGVGTDPKGGNIVNIQHDNGVRTYSAHLGTINVHKGDKVGYETIIGTVGESGNAAGTWPHCHFQVWVNGTITDPARFFAVPAYKPVTKNEAKWLPGQEQIAKSFNVQDHIKQNPRKALASRINKICDLYLKYAIQK